MTNAALVARQQAALLAKADGAFALDRTARAAEAERTNFLAIPTREAGSPDLIELEEAFRRSTFAPPLLFTSTDEATGEETWDEGEGQRWAARMDWPRVPTLDEAAAWVGYEAATAARKEWMRRFGQDAGAAAEQGSSKASGRANTPPGRSPSQRPS